MFLGGSSADPQGIGPAACALPEPSVFSTLAVAVLHPVFLGPFPGFSFYGVGAVVLPMTALINIPADTFLMDDHAVCTHCVLGCLPPMKWRGLEPPWSRAPSLCLG